MLHVARVEAPSGSRENRFTLWALNGLTQSTSTEIRWGATDSVIDIRPRPALPVLVQSEMAPVPLSGPLNVLFIEGSSVSCGAHRIQSWKLLMSAKIFSGGALMLSERSIRKVLGLVAAKASTAPIRTATMMRDLKIMGSRENNNSPASTLTTSDPTSSSAISYPATRPSLSRTPELRLCVPE